jgi:uncharacterized protein
MRSTVGGSKPPSTVKLHFSSHFCKPSPQISFTMTGKTQSTSKIAQILYGLLAYVSLGIGLVAIVIPGLPTTEFILLAAWAATKSSPRLSAWLENHRLFGPILFNWRNGKIIARRAKVSATVSMLLCAIVMLVMLDHGWPIYLAIAGMSLGNLWIWSRPERHTQPL